MHTQEEDSSVFFSQGLYEVGLESGVYCYHCFAAHLNHFLELYCQQRYSFIKASMIVGLQLGYTVIFGFYASFLFMRTGHLLAPIVAHIFCNMMGLPVLSARNKGLTSVAFVAGVAGFLWFLFPATHPDLYNDRTDSCRCWHGYCRWN
ncbi:CAAX prenyl protease 2-like [Macadamia integrifolia]|uniref:CAAX prenyl protease 2-like n=1 Tax=Macadamia integrifolia TaxID=60698 RepID=UPI001C5006CF|nr:CAAX prenyl protease 2-like [Macadamia integrifolia]